MTHSRHSRPAGLLTVTETCLQVDTRFRQKVHLLADDYIQSESCGAHRQSRPKQTFHLPPSRNPAKVLTGVAVPVSDGGKPAVVSVACSRQLVCIHLRRQAEPVPDPCRRAVSPTRRRSMLHSLFAGPPKRQNLAKTESQFY